MRGNLYVVQLVWKVEYGVVELMEISQGFIATSLQQELNARGKACESL